MSHGVGGMSRAAKGADCKSAGYAFVGSSPTSPTTAPATRFGRLGVSQHPEHPPQPPRRPSRPAGGDAPQSPYERRRPERERRAKSPCVVDRRGGRHREARQPRQRERDQHALADRRPIDHGRSPRPAPRAHPARGGARRACVGRIRRRRLRRPRRQHAQALGGAAAPGRSASRRRLSHAVRTGAGLSFASTTSAPAPCRHREASRLFETERGADHAPAPPARHASSNLAICSASWSWL